jgi:2-polyprenyl-3-methyl-5-hydroxy-6-metoxy-1,4-benzoquinol methylase
MKYGASDHYTEAKGEAYFAAQNRLAADEASVTTWKFRPWVKPTDRVLDFGCAGGWILKNLDCAERVGVELNPVAHAFCRENGVKVYSSLEQVTERDFDVIISHHCLEHVPYPLEALRAIRGLLKDGGNLVLIVPIDDWRVERDFTGSDIDHHLQTWTPRLMANTLIEAGFLVTRIDVLTHALFPQWTALAGVVPAPIFKCLCWLTSVVKKRRQLLALAEKPHAPRA